MDKKSKKTRPLTEGQQKRNVKKNPPSAKKAPKPPSTKPKGKK